MNDTSHGPYVISLTLNEEDGTQAFLSHCRTVPQFETPQSRKRAFTRNTSHLYVVPLKKSGNTSKSSKDLVNGLNV